MWHVHRCLPLNSCIHSKTAHAKGTQEVEYVPNILPNSNGAPAKESSTPACEKASDSNDLASLRIEPFSRLNGTPLNIESQGDERRYCVGEIQQA